MKKRSLKESLLGEARSDVSPPAGYPTHPIDVALELIRSVELDIDKMPVHIKSHKGLKILETMFQNLMEARSILDSIDD